MRPTRTVLALTAAAGLGLSLAGAAPAGAAATSYVALGDSYSSGTGTRSYIADGTTCQRSTLAYPSLIAAARGYTLNFRACSGATTADVTSTQLSALSSATTHVSISVGGNDAGFADVLTECAKPGWMSSCDSRIDSAQSYIRGTLPGRLSTLYASIKAKAPSARVVVVGYPRIFNGEDCNALTWFSPAEESRLNATADLLNSITATQAGAKGFTYANPTSAFVGHAVCDSPEWLNGLSSPITESYHPNQAGHASGYAPTVSPRLTGTTLQVSPALTTQARASSDELAATQRQYRESDRRITPKPVRIPDLGTPAARAAAERAGVDLTSRASIDAADRRYSDRQHQAWLARR